MRRPVKKPNCGSKPKPPSTDRPKYSIRPVRPKRPTLAKK